jgi:hypothetical protein
MVTIADVSALRRNIQAIKDARAKHAKMHEDAAAEADEAERRLAHIDAVIAGMTESVAAKFLDMAVNARDDALKNARGAKRTADALDNELRSAHAEIEKARKKAAAAIAAARKAPAPVQMPDDKRQRINNNGAAAAKREKELDALKKAAADTDTPRSDYVVKWNAVAIRDKKNDFFKINKKTTNNGRQVDVQAVANAIMAEHNAHGGHENRGVACVLVDATGKPIAWTAKTNDNVLDEIKDAKNLVKAGTIHKGPHALFADAYKNIVVIVPNELVHAHDMFDKKFAGMAKLRPKAFVHARPAKMAWILM